MLHNLFQIICITTMENLLNIYKLLLKSKLTKTNNYFLIQINVHIKYIIIYTTLKKELNNLVNPFQVKIET